MSETPYERYKRTGRGVVGDLDDDGRDEVPGLPEGGWVGGDDLDDDKDTEIPGPTCPDCGAAVGAGVCPCRGADDEGGSGADPAELYRELGESGA